ncbi:MAG: hypothetical protein MZV63_21375 [Marinilabiliales bacterium]|nr:hypothetical protein [Marinilabiliales bacterium]
MMSLNQPRRKIEAGLKRERNEIFFHTGPHHDDIMLGIFPAIIPQLREITQQVSFLHTDLRFYGRYQHHAARACLKRR